MQASAARVTVTKASAARSTVTKASAAGASKPQQLLQNLGHAFFRVGGGHVIRLLLHMLRAVGHRHAKACEAQHIHIVFRVAKGDNLLRQYVEPGGRFPQIGMGNPAGGLGFLL